MEWLQLRVREAGGAATLWEARPGTVAAGGGLVGARGGRRGGRATLGGAGPGAVAEEGELVGTFRAAREEAYGKLIAGAERVRRMAEMGGGAALSEPLGKLERAFRAERRGDYFRSAVTAGGRAAGGAGPRGGVRQAGARVQGGAEAGLLPFAAQGRGPGGPQGRPPGGQGGAGGR